MRVWTNVTWMKQTSGGYKSFVYVTLSQKYCKGPNLRTWNSLPGTVMALEQQKAALMQPWVGSPMDTKALAFPQPLPLNFKLILWKFSQYLKKVNFLLRSTSSRAGFSVPLCLSHLHLCHWIWVFPVVWIEEFFFLFTFFWFLVGCV